MLLRILIDRPEALSPPIFHSMEWQSVATVLPAGLPRRPSIATQSQSDSTNQQRANDYLNITR